MSKKRVRLFKSDDEDYYVSIETFGVDDTFYPSKAAKHFAEYMLRVMPCAVWRKVAEALWHELYNMAEVDLEDTEIDELLQRTCKYLMSVSTRIEFPEDEADEYN